MWSRSRSFRLQIACRLPETFVLSLILGSIVRCANPIPSDSTDPPLYAYEGKWGQHDTSSTCDYRFQKKGSFGKASELPSGFVVYNVEGKKGLRIQNLSDTASFLIPNTQDDLPYWVSMTDDARWVFYLDVVTMSVKYITPYGGHKGVAPTSHAISGYPQVVGIWHNAGAHQGFFYLADSLRLRLVRFVEDAGNLTFVDDRAIIDIGQSDEKIVFLSEQIAASSNRITGEFFRSASSVDAFTFQATLDLESADILTTDDLFPWTDSYVISSRACGYAISRDGQFVAHNPGEFYPTGMFQCTPLNHKGFLLAKFCQRDRPVGIHDYFVRDGVTSNWCPPAFRYGDPPLQNDFYRWYFAEDNRYLFGRVSGANTDHRGIWVVDWESNTWTCISNLNSSINADFLAPHFGTEIDLGEFEATVPEDSSQVPPPVVDLLNPVYQIVSPNGGENFFVGDTCYIKIRAARNANAILFFEMGDYTIRLPGITTSINPRADSLFFYVFPDSVLVIDNNGLPAKVPTAGQEWFAVLADYNGNYQDRSDSSFSVNR